MVHGIEPHEWLCADGMEPAWDSLSSSFSAPPPLALTFSLSQNKLTLKKKEEEEKGAAGGSIG